MAILQIRTKPIESQFDDPAKFKEASEEYAATSSFKKSLLAAPTTPTAPTAIDAAAAAGEGIAIPAAITPQSTVTAPTTTIDTTGVDLPTTGIFTDEQREDIRGKIIRGESITNQLDTQEQRRELANIIGGLVGEEVEGFDPNIAVTNIERAKKQVEEFAKQAEFEQSQEAKAQELENLGLDRAAEALRRSVSAAKASRSAGRSGGAVSGPSTALPAALQVGGEKILQESKLTIEKAREARAEALRRAALAREEGNNSLAATFEAEARNQEVKEQAAVADAEERLAKIDEQQQKTAQTKLDTILDMPAAALAGMDENSVGAIFQAAGYDPLFAGNFISASNDLAEAEKKKDDLAIKTAEIKLAGLQDGLETAAQKNIDNLIRLDDALAAGEITQDVYDYMKGELGLGEQPLGALDRIKAAKEMREMYGDASLPTQSSEGITSQLTEENELIINLPDDYTATGRYSGDFPGNNGIYCAEFVNDFWGVARGSGMGNEFTNKMGFVDRNIKDPVPGMAFVTETNMPEGHTGIVLKNYGNGMIKVMDFNNDGKSGQKSVYDMSIQDVFKKGGGFAINPNAVKKSDENKTTTSQSQQQNGLSWGIKINKDSAYEDFSPLQQILLDNPKTQEGVQNVIKTVLQVAAADGLDTKESFQELVTTYKQIGLSDSQIEGIFEALDTQEGIGVKVFGWSYKDGEVVEQNWWDRKF